MVANQTPQVTEAATDQDPTTNLLFTPKGYGFELWTHRFSPGGMRLTPGSYGKSGGAGTFMWIDPQARADRRSCSRTTACRCRSTSPAGTC